MIKPGQDWGAPASGPPDVALTGDDAQLARLVATTPGALVDFRPSEESDIARAVGLPRGASSGIALPLDALRIDDSRVAVNMIVVGTPPDRLTRLSRRLPVQVTVDGHIVFDNSATTIVIATGQFLRALDLVPRSHPGDGRAEVQIYAVEPPQRRALRSRLPTGTHVPHPGITQRTGRHVLVECGRPAAVEIDGQPLEKTDRLTVEIAPNAYRLLL